LSQGWETTTFNRPLIDPDPNACIQLPTLSAKDAERMGHGGFKLQVQQRIAKTSRGMLGKSHGKDGKQRAFPTFPRHGYGDLYDSIHEICCTWSLNPPTQFVAAIKADQKIINFSTA
jgi:hypothetical protein